MFYKEDHGVPHFHVVYEEHKASVSIETLEVLAGSLPGRALKLVQEWAALHREELSANWRRAREEAPLEQIDPLP
jgi:hypothetical protein